MKPSGYRETPYYSYVEFSPDLDGGIFIANYHQAQIVGDRVEIEVPKGHGKKILRGNKELLERYVRVDPSQPGQHEVPLPTVFSVYNSETGEGKIIPGTFFTEYDPHVSLLARVATRVGEAITTGGLGGRE